MDEDTYHHGASSNAQAADYSAGVKRSQVTSDRAEGDGSTSNEDTRGDPKTLHSTKVVACCICHR